MSRGTSDKLLYDLVDEIGIEVDRFRAAEADAEDVRFLTGIELAIGAAGYLAAAFARGFVKGVEQEAQKAGIDPESLGKRAGRWTVKSTLDAAERLGRRTRQIVSGSHLEPDEESELGVQLDELLAGLNPAGELPEDVRRAAVEGARIEMLVELRENGFDSARADDLAERLVARLESARTRSADS